MPALRCEVSDYMFSILICPTDQPSARTTLARIGIGLSLPMLKQAGGRIDGGKKQANCWRGEGTTPSLSGINRGRAAAAHEDLPGRHR